MDNYNRDYRAMQYETASTAVAENTLIKNVYLWMCGALVITGLTSYYVANNFSLQEAIFSSPLVFYGLIIAEFALVIGLTAAINKISALTATLMFLLYSVINGATLSSIFLIYEIGSITTTFFVTAGTFGAMAIYGSITQRDLTKLGGILTMALIGIILATLVNLFLKSGMMDTIISIIGVIIFVGLTAYDAQKIKAMLGNAEINDTTQKLAVLGALTLYLDFVNLFLYLLRFMGKRNN
ncbi:MAG: Bax inhibitor-1/YccA family protein [Bacteroidaceae bacterium]|nr:Bax inhibitor-1/YccA family protein [Bacteroidaceae bacterium]